MYGIIQKIESILYNKAIKMETISIEEDLGTIIFESTLFNYSKNLDYKKKAEALIDKLIEVFPEADFGSGFIDGFEGIFWTINYAFKCGVITSDEMLEDIEPYLLKSLNEDFKTGNFDLLYGSIGKLLYYIESNTDKEKQEQLINAFLFSLYNTKIENEYGIYWIDEEEGEGLVNLGIAHGLTSILIFLVNLKEKKYNHEYIEILIKGILKSLSSFENEKKCISSYASFFATTDANPKRIDSRLAWCTGDLGIIYALLYAGDVLHLQDLKAKAHKMLEKVLVRGISHSSLDHFDDYSFFDTGLCHGISGILFMLIKINEKLNNEAVSKRISYWENQLLSNVNNLIETEEDIYFPWYKQDENYSFTLDKESMLNGLCGTGLVLLSLHYKKYDWSKPFLLY